MYIPLETHLNMLQFMQYYKIYDVTDSKNVFNTYNLNVKIVSYLIQAEVPDLVSVEEQAHR